MKRASEVVIGKDKMYIVDLLKYHLDDYPIRKSELPTINKVSEFSVKEIRNYDDKDFPIEIVGINENKERIYHYFKEYMTDDILNVGHYGLTCKDTDTVRYHSIYITFDKKNAYKVLLEMLEYYKKPLDIVKNIDIIYEINLIIQQIEKLEL